MGERREPLLTRNEQGADRWSLPAERLREILNSNEKDRRQSYAEMLDRYHDIFEFLKELETMGASGRIQVDQMRDRLHKQLLRVGETLQKNAAEVQVDLLRREGNLAEYGLPEYGILSAVDIFPGSIYDQHGFGGLDVNRKNQGFSRTLSEAKLLNEKNEWNEDNDADDEYKEEFLKRGRVVDVPPFGMVPYVETLQLNKVAILFGISFTIDIESESCPMIPADYPERLRRAFSAAQELNGSLFMRTVGAYHDTTTVIGVVVDAEQLDPVAVGLLRNQRPRFGIRKEDMDSMVIEHDLKEEIERIKREFAPEGESRFVRRALRRKEGDHFFEEYLEKREKFFGKGK
ncbi:MAG: hypothetical protein HY437_02430 [Candidatus Magasanikbacteria bacterium]|nr:hypothetical protein [Candidatus Magasanikbacteria bacterium]